MIKFRCPSCNQKLGVPDEYAGKRVRCTRCKEATQIPQPELPVLEEVAVEPVLETGEDVGGDMSADEAFSEGMWDDFAGEEDVDSADAERQEAIAQSNAPQRKNKTSHIGPQRGGKSRVSGGGDGSALSKLKTPLLIVIGLVVVIGILIAVVGKGGGGEDDGRGERAIQFAENFLRTARQLDPDQVADMLWTTADEFGDEFGDYSEENAQRTQREITEVLNALNQGNVKKIDSSMEYSRFANGASGFLIHCQIEYDTSYRVAEIGVVESGGDFDLAGIIASDSTSVLASVGGSDSDMLIEKIDILVDDFGLPQGLGAILVADHSRSPALLCQHVDDLLQGRRAWLGFSCAGLQFCRVSEGGRQTGMDGADGDSGGTDSHNRKHDQYWALVRDLDRSCRDVWQRVLLRDRISPSAVHFLPHPRLFKRASGVKRERFIPPTKRF